MIKKRPSAVLTGDGVVCPTPSYFWGFVCVTGGTNRTLAFYDNATGASGTVIEKFVADANKTVDGHEHHTPVDCDNGIYANIAGAGESVVVYFWPKGVSV